ncbi:MAG: DUF1761 domain-containing protein [Prolixibacteraceae bacterium]
MEVQVNFLAVILATVASYVIASLWYGLIFAKPWKKLTGIKDMKPLPLNILLVLVGSFIMSFVLYHSIAFGNAFLKTGGISGGMMGGFWDWLGYIAPVTLCTKLYENKPWKLWLLDNGFWLIALLVMGGIIGGMM